MWRRSTGPLGAGEHHRPRLQVLRRRAGIVGGIQRSFGDGDIACGVDEFGELGIGHLMGLYPEPVDADFARRPLLGVVRSEPSVVVCAGIQTRSGSLSH